MSGTSPSLNIDTKKTPSSSSLKTVSPDGNEAENFGDDLVELEISAGETGAKADRSSHGSTDLVRLYLSEIGRVPLLRRDEEIAEAQRVQRYLQLQSVRDDAVASGDRVLSRFADLSKTCDRLTVQLGTRPSPARWASAAAVEVDDLEQALADGRERWSQLAKMTVSQLSRTLLEGERAKKHMVRANLRLVVSVAKKYQNRGLDLLDLIQEGSLGLERAVEKFDPTKGFRFSTYSYWWIRQGITHAIASQSRTIRLPIHLIEKLNKIKRVQRQIIQEGGRFATVEDIAESLNVESSQVHELLMCMPRAVSMDLKVGKERDTELSELLETDDISPEDRFARESLQQDLHNLLSELSERERDVVRLRYGLSDGIARSLAEIGRTLALSRERVRQIEGKAMQKLQQPKRRNRLRDYLEAFE
ncbi:RNA polymerase sigma factor SigC [Rubidibacter lacunae]|nr:RNA polymerase sigma factor SigC [Rubidibacter lacunae]